MYGKKNKFAFTGEHLQNIKNKFEEKTGVRPNRKPSRIQLSLRRPAVAIALMACLTMLVSAAAVAVIYKVQYVPHEGFVEGGEYEIYYTPKILKLGDTAVVETITRVKKGGTSELSIIITDTLDQNIKIKTEKHGEFELTPARDYMYSSFGTLGKYQFHNEGGYSSYGYFVKDFPEINEFTLVSGGESAEVGLLPSNPDDVLTAEGFGVSMRFYSMSRGSKVLAYEMTENNFDVVGKTVIKNTYYNFLTSKTVELTDSRFAFRLYDEKGNKIGLNGFDYSGSPDGAGFIMFLRIGRDEKIGRIEIERVTVSIDAHILNIHIDDVPIPADGEEIVFDGGLPLYDENGLKCTIGSITRKGDEFTVFSNTEYTGKDIANIENIENMHIMLGSRENGINGKMFGFGRDTFKMEENKESVRLYLDAIRYSVKGNWEIIFN